MAHLVSYPLQPRQKTNEGGESDQIHDQSSRLPFHRLMIAYTCLAFIFFISYFDVNSVSTALPAISHSLDAGNTITWTGTAYLLGQTVFQPLYGRLSDIFGRKPVLMICISFLIFGDILCGFAQNMIWLYTCRALSGIGGGGISSLVSIIVSDLVSLKERGKYQGMLSAAIGLGSSTGPFIAAALLRDPEGWRWTFWVSPILAAGCMVLTWIFLPLKPVVGSWREKMAKIDWLGIFTAVTGIVFLLVPINSGGSTFPWNSPLVISMLTIGGLFCILFGFIEKRLARIPIIPSRLFSDKSTTALYFQSLLYAWVWHADLYFIPIYFQDVRGYTPLQSATFILPLLLFQSIFGVISGPIMTKLERFGPVLYSGMALWTVGAGLKVLFAQTTPVAIYVVVLAIEGAGAGFIMQPALVALQALSRPEDRAVATSTRNLMRMLGATAGLAVSTAIRFEVTTSALPDNIPPSIRDQLIQSEGSWANGTPGFEEWDSVMFDAKTKGVNAVFITMAPLLGLCLLSCYFVPNIVLKGDPETSDDKEERTLDNRNTP
ncbi:major facilitator superfamily-domain-containing protein [Whalleya microplaca]|nr:major facilitator superfamily-domain-containing protein [Whalleya microplaca]